MPFCADLLAPTSDSSTPKEKLGEMLRAYSAFKEAVLRGLHSQSGTNVAWVYARCCTRVARNLRVVTEPKNAGATIYFLSLSAQKLEAVVRDLQALVHETNCPREALGNIKALVVAKRARRECIETAVGVFAEGGDPRAQPPNAFLRVEALLLKPRPLDRFIHKFVERVLQRLVITSRAPPKPF